MCLNRYKIAFVLILLFAMQKVLAQGVGVDPQQLISDIIEDMSSKTDQEIDYTPIVEDLMYLFENPLNINQCSIEDLSKLAFLSDFQVKSLWDYIQTNGNLLSIYELQLIFGFEREDIQRIAPFIKLGNPNDLEPLKYLLRNGRHEVSVKSSTILENQAGYKNPSTPEASRYLGSKYSLYTRYSFQAKDRMAFGLIAEKDAGEQFFKGANQKGFDYLSGYFTLSKVGLIKKLVVGDFDAEFGQGLTFWSNLSAGKSSNPLGIRKRPRGLVKHSSANENIFLRGAGVTIPIKKFDITIFGSYKKIDASLEDTIIDDQKYFTSLPQSGLHRTPKEILSKRVLGELIAGGNVSYKGRKMNGGITISHVRVDGGFRVDSSLYKLYSPSPTGRTNIGFNLQRYIKNHLLFGEAAIEPKTSEHAVLIGGLFKLSPLVEFSVLGRSYTRGYTNIYTSAFAEGSGAYNEKGIFTGITLFPIKRLTLSGYVDIFSFPWLKYRVNAPSTGHEYLVQSEYRFSATFTGQVRYKLKRAEQNYIAECDRMVVVIPQNSQSARVQFTYTPDKRLMLRSRFDFTEFSSDSTGRERGYALSQDIGYTHPKYPITVSFRFAIFDTPSWNTRIYSYESDMLYTFSVPAYSSKGIRTYIMLAYSPTSRIDCWLRWSQTYYSDVKEIGQGLDLINSNQKNDLRLMVRVRF